MRNAALCLLRSIGFVDKLQKGLRREDSFPPKNKSSLLLLGLAKFLPIGVQTGTPR